MSPSSIVRRAFASIACAALLLNACAGSESGGAGSAGTNGNGGTTATAGTTGSAGTSGSAGTTGAAGTTGIAGNTGTSGTTGAAGTTGGGATTGGAGTSGLAGTTGTAGRGGSTGGAGRGGTTGTAGTTGAAGTSGSAGIGGGGRGGAAGTTGSGGSSGTCPASALPPGDSTKSVMVGTLNRSYVLHIPTGYTGTKPLPLVIDFHPLGSTGSSWESGDPWKAKADSVGFIMAYPNSYNSNNSWNVGFCCQDAQKNQIDDVAFTKAMIQQIGMIACLDAKRVYATGCSNGGGMTYKAACDLADMIAAGAPVDFRCVYGGSTQSPSCMGCKPSRPISITHFDNTGDTSLVPYNGGTTSFAADCPPNMSCVGMAFPSAQANFTSFQAIDGCTGAVSGLAGHSACQTNASCQAGAQVTMCVRQGGSHCGNYAALGIVDIAWEMFQKQALP